MVLHLVNQCDFKYQNVILITKSNYKEQPQLLFVLPILNSQINQ
jgi:hypothetical protein